MTSIVTIFKFRDSVCEPSATESEPSVSVHLTMFLPFVFAPVHVLLPELREMWKNDIIDEIYDE